ncbi:hypothetical protein E2562_025118 [Oryza meyeriana var. granulata]|uniref:Uncharacterized protein n=1 Tax=Oryza meyeriana var. granulata TaxID=110450 RepID=A0A6G1CGW8_9ORYZ|nr:hypothetical protein E2562_025118 [Oryza meyeriana var. granulata]KAF0899876.1 hypothetical protein E2562_025118 [Oryza meyeriana var. granulata]
MDNLALLRGILGPGVAAPSLARAGGSGSTPSSAAPSRSPSSTTSPVRLPLLFSLVLGAGSVWTDLVTVSRNPGILASLAALMVNCMNKDEIGHDYYSPYGDDSEWRVKLWLFVAYVVSFVCLAGAVGLLVQDALTDKGPSL